MEASAAPRSALPRHGGFVPTRVLRVSGDDRLVDLVRRGSQPAFEVLYDRHHRGILSFCRHMLGNREEAEDALQHTFMAAYRDMLASEKEIQLRAWLYAIARNRCLSVLRSRRERPVDEMEDVPTEGLAAAVERRQDLQDLLRDLAALPEDQRAALVLAEVGDLPHDDIAAVIGCPKDKVKALVFQARTSLHNSREARETSCDDIREMLSSLRGGSLRRTALRRHLRECAGCREFQAEVKRQRQAMAVLLPVVPSLGLKDAVLGAAFSSGGAVAAGTVATAGAGAGAVAAAGGGAATAAKVLVVAAALGGGAAGATAVSDDKPDRPAKAATAIERIAEKSPKPPAGPPAVAPAVAETPTAGETETAENDDKPRKGRRRGQTDRGKEFAKTRGGGNKRGLNGTQPGKTEDKQERAERRRERRAEREQARQEKRATKRAKKRAVRKAKKRVVPRRQTKPTKKPQAQPKPTPEPKAKPAPEPTPEPTPTPAPLLPDDPPGKSKQR